MTHSESATAAQNSGLLSPPPSTRTSLDTLPTAPVGAVAACAPLPIHLSFNPLASPPESVAGSPLTKRCSNLLALQNFVRVGPRQEALNVEIKGVTPLISRELLKDLERYLVETSQGGTWESLLIDICHDKLVVRFPLAGHEIMHKIMNIMSNSGTSYPRVYGTSKITEGGSMGIPLYGGTSKTPDHSMYNILAGREYSDVQDSCIPTIVFEVAYTQSSRDLAENAARHICLTLGQVLLVVAIDIIRTKDEPKRLFSVTWSHWEEDVNARKLIVPNLDNGDDNMVRAEREGDEDDEEHILPPAKAFSATVCIRDIITSEDERHHIRATETQRWQLFPTRETDRIEIFHRQLVRDPAEADAKIPAFSFSTSDIMSVIYGREAHQEQFEIFKKPGLKRDAETRIRSDERLNARRKRD